jgi:fused signal recognition particle receptor
MTSLFGKLKQALVKTSDKVSSGIDNIFFKKKLDEQTLEELEELLLTADISSSVVSILLNDLRSQKFDKEVSIDIIKETLANSITKILDIQGQSFTLKQDSLNIILVCGVNGNGKTTTIGKLAMMYSLKGLKVAVAACDTFRAAAVEQLENWTLRAGVTLFKGDDKADPASVAYTAIKKSIDDNVNVLFIDTAGRLHNHKNLMDELTKIVKTIQKIDCTAPHHSILVIDATTGQNAYNQVEQFKNSAGLTSLIVTKLDGTAKAGVVIGIIEKFKLPIHFIGIGEKVDDLKIFKADSFAKAIVN